jgi:hypothetical protein
MLLKSKRSVARNGRNTLIFSVAVGNDPRCQHAIMLILQAAHVQLTIFYSNATIYCVDSGRGPTKLGLEA